jgi:hypothetical protein
MRAMLTGFEPRHQKVISRLAFAKRMTLAIGLSSLPSAGS